MTAAHIVWLMRSFRRILAALLVLAFGLGMAAYGVEASEMTQMTVAADQPMPDDCDGCGSSDMARASVCMLACPSGLGIVPQAQPPALLVTGHAYEGMPEQRILGSSSAPDPHPPKSRFSRKQA
ncbi:hypothetical protein [Inquilinus sp. CAU 1745]|uniref:hypothetical protein n=1 Tax=Inquilinus sp. CAU 1745 TaxID=3140369 RepID=UPI00325B644F